MTVNVYCSGDGEWIASRQIVTASGRIFERDVLVRPRDNPIGQVTGENRALALAIAADRYPDDEIVCLTPEPAARVADPAAVATIEATLVSMARPAR